MPPSGNQRDSLPAADRGSLARSTESLRELEDRARPTPEVVDRWHTEHPARRAGRPTIGRIDWSVMSVDSTSCRAHQHAAGALQRLIVCVAIAPTVHADTAATCADNRSSTPSPSWHQMANRRRRGSVGWSAHRLRQAHLQPQKRSGTHHQRAQGIPRRGHPLRQASVRVPRHGHSRRTTPVAPLITAAEFRASRCQPGCPGQLAGRHAS